MRFKKLLALIIISTFLLTGCKNDKKYNEYMEEGQQAVKQEQYEDALDYFESALTEKDGDTEATSLHTQVEKILQVEAKIKNKLYDEAIELCNEIIKSDSESSVCRDAAQSLKSQCEKLKEEQENLTFKEEIDKKIDEAKKLMDKEEYMNAKVKLGYIIEEVTGKPSYTEELKECNSLLKTCNDKIDELANKEKEEKENNKTENKDSNTNQTNNKNNNSDKNNNNNSNNNSSNNSEKIDFNDELKKQIAVAGEAYVEFYFEHEDEMKFDSLWEKYNCYDIAISYFTNRLGFMQELQCDCDNVGDIWITSMAKLSQKEIEEKTFEKTVLSVDPAAASKTESDYFAFTVGSKCKGLYFVRKGILKKINVRVNFDLYVDTVIFLLMKYETITHIILETNVFKGIDAGRIEEKIKSIDVLKRRHIQIIDIYNTKNKDDRISTITKKINSGQVVFNESDQEYNDQVKDFKGQEFTLHDDAIDSLEMFINNIDNIKVVAPKVEILDKKKFF